MGRRDGMATADIEAVFEGSVSGDTDATDLGDTINDSVESAAVSAIANSDGDFISTDAVPSVSTVAEIEDITEDDEMSGEGSGEMSGDGSGEMSGEGSGEMSGEGSGDMSGEGSGEGSGTEETTAEPTTTESTDTTTADVSTTESTTSVSVTSTIEVETVVTYEDDLADTSSDAYATASDAITDLFESDIESAADDNDLSVESMTVTFAEGSARRRRRDTTATATIEVVLTGSVSTGTDLDTLESTVDSAVTTAAETAVSNSDGTYVDSSASVSVVTAIDDDTTTTEAAPTEAATTEAATTEAATT